MSTADSQFTAMLRMVGGGMADGAQWALASGGGGKSGPMDALLPLVYGSLRSLAAHHLKSERENHTLGATALVHEVYLKLVHQQDANFVNRAQFLAVCAQAIRRILVDHARYRLRAKRGSGVPVVSLEEATLISDKHQWNLLDLDEAISKLAVVDKRRARVVELRFFAGLKIEEIAELLDVTDRTVRSDWTFARAWLFRELAEG